MGQECSDNDNANEEVTMTINYKNYNEHDGGNVSGDNDVE